MSGRPSSRERGIKPLTRTPTASRMRLLSPTLSSHGGREGEDIGDLASEPHTLMTQTGRNLMSVKACLVAAKSNRCAFYETVRAPVPNLAYPVHVLMRRSCFRKR